MKLPHPPDALPHEFIRYLFSTEYPPEALWRGQEWARQSCWLAQLCGQTRTASRWWEFLKYLYGLEDAHRAIMEQS